MTSTITLTAGLPNGPAQQTLRMLQGKGITVEDYAAIGTNEVLCADVAAMILKHRLFTQPEEQIQHLLRINEQVWKDASITEVAIRALGDPPECPISDEGHLWCVTLVSETGNALATFTRNWTACVHVHGVDKTWKWDGLILTPQGVRPRQNAKPRPTGLRWTVSELGRAYKSQKVKKVRPDLDRQSTMGMGQELPLIGALHPRWAVAMNGDNIPFVDAPDLEVAPSARGEFSDAPYLSFDRGDGAVNLYAGVVDHGNPRFGSGSLR